MDQMERHVDRIVARPRLPEEGEVWPTQEMSSGTKLSAGDICFMLYRHKWKIIFFSLAGIAAAVGIYLLSPKLYRSKAKVMVKYVPETKQFLRPDEAEAQKRSEVMQGDQAVGSELEILTTRDLAKQIAADLGPDKILASLGGGTNLDAAALVINKGTIANVTRGNVIQVSFEHPDPALVQPVLSDLLKEYVKRHWQIHRAFPNLDDFQAQKERIQQQLTKAEKELLDFKRTNGVFSLEQAKKRSADRIRRLEEALSEAQTQLLYSQAMMQSFPESSVTNTVPVKSEDQEQDLEKYAKVAADLELSKKTEMQYLGQGFTRESGMLADVAKDIRRLEQKKKELELKNPGLLASVAVGGTNRLYNPAVIQATISALQQQLGRAQGEEAKIYALEEPISALERKRNLNETNYTYFASSLEQAQFDSALGASRYSNISQIEEPTAPERVIVPIAKRMAMAVAAGIGFGVGLALLLELFVDQSIKRPVELERVLSVPLYLSIPNQQWKKRPRALPDGSPQVDTRSPDHAPMASLPVAASSRGAEPSQSYFEALRDRVLNRFETLARKPKLVGVCGCSESPGATKTAVGLAAALSEAGDLKVLLVDMKRGLPVRGQSTNGKRSCTLVDALEHQKREEGLIAPNLYLASSQSAVEEPMITSPTKFNRMVPKLNASDYDYIVFDLPPVDQVSVTPRLAKHMDLTLLVVEAEKESKNLVRNAGSLLLEFTPHLATVLNDTQANLPKWLKQLV